MFAGAVGGTCGSIGARREGVAGVGSCERGGKGDTGVTTGARAATRAAGKVLEATGLCTAGASGFPSGAGSPGGKAIGR